MASRIDILREATRLLQEGQSPGAQRMLEAALRDTPRDPDMLALLGLSYAQQGDNDRAAGLMADALSLNPNHISTLVNYTRVLTRLQRWPEVAATATRALAQRPDHMEARRMRGLAHAALQHDAEALADLDAVTTDNLGTLMTRAKLRYASGRASEAVGDYDRALAIAPDHWEALNNRGIALEALNRFDEALSCYERALQLNPADLSLQHNRAANLVAQRRAEDALPLFSHLIEVEPDNADNWNGYGAALANFARFDEAKSAFEKALTLDPGSTRALVCRGTILAALGETAEAIAEYRQALHIDPANATAHANLAFALLTDGRLSEGFAEYEWRRKDGPIRLNQRQFPKPEWQGEDLSGKTLLLHPEQGLGDIIQFARFVPELAARGARVVLEVPPPLEILMRTLAGNATVVRAGTPLPPFDVHAPLMSLGLRLGLTLDRIPAPIPYLFAPEERRGKWQERLRSLARPRVGLCWSGNKDHNNDRARSIAFDLFAGIADIERVSFVSLQHELRDSDRAAFAAKSNIANFMPDVADMADTAALIGELDLVICVDTSVAHLAGALGKPVWILLATSSDWRWLKERSDSPWYPTATLFRQTAHGDWSPVIERVQEKLRLER